MKRTFVESSTFSKRIDHEGTEVLQKIQIELIKNPEIGRVIQGTGGLRKMRFADASRGKGKRGGYRVIYLDVAVAERTYLLAIYNKDTKDEITPQEKKILKKLVEKLKREIQ